MRISEFEFTPENHFVAMEYYWLILNRTFLVFITDDALVGVKVRGVVGVDNGDPLARMLAVGGDLTNPYSYIGAGYMNKVKDMDLKSDSLLRANGANFRIAKADIVEATYDKSKKWGMGNYPHDGKVYVKTKDNRQREFIILGAQSGEAITNRLR